MKIIYSLALTIFSIFISQAQIENKKVIFSDKGDYVLIDYNENIIYYEFDEVKKCSYDSYLRIIGKNEDYNLLAHKDSIYFEFFGDREKTKNIDSIFCKNNSLQYKNKDTSFRATYIFDKMSKENFYKKYELNQVGKLINNEIKYKIENVRDTLFDYSPVSDIIKPYKIDAKIFTLVFYHKERILKKIDLELIFILEFFDKNYINRLKLRKENDKLFISYLNDLIKEIDLCIINQGKNNKIIDFEIYNHQKKYYFDYDVKHFYFKQCTLPEGFYIDEAFDNGKLKPNVDTFYQVFSSEKITEPLFNGLFILD